MSLRKTHPLLAVLVKRRDRSGREVIDEECVNNRTPSPSTARKASSSSPQRISRIVDVSHDAEKSLGIAFALVNRLLLECQSLHLSKCFDNDTDSEHRDAEDEISVRDFAGCGGGGGSAEEEERVGTVPECVEDRDNNRPTNSPSLLSNAHHEPDVLKRRHRNHS